MEAFNENRLFERVGDLADAMRSTMNQVNAIHPEFLSLMTKWRVGRWGFMIEDVYSQGQGHSQDVIEQYIPRMAHGGHASSTTLDFPSYRLVACMKYADISRMLWPFFYPPFPCYQLWLFRFFYNYL